MGIACTMGRILQRGCGEVREPPPPPPCPEVHLDPLHDRTVVIESPPASWTMPVTIAWGDGSIDVSPDGEDAHTYPDAGAWTIVASDAQGLACSVVVVVV